MRRSALYLAILAAVLGGLFVAPAQAVTITGGDPVRQTMVRNVFAEKPGLVKYVESVWPISVRINYGGHAFAGGRMDVNVEYVYPKFTWNVAHELAHLVQLAADAPGGYPAIGQDWLQLIRERSSTPESKWIWDLAIAGGRYNPWECFAENVARAYHAPYYTGRTTPDTYLMWLSRADMTAFLLAHGCDPYAR